MKYAFLFGFLFLLTNPAWAQSPNCEYILPQPVTEIPRNACFELTFTAAPDSSGAPDRAFEGAYVCSESDTIPLKILLACQNGKQTQLLLQPTALLEPDQAYHLLTRHSAVRSKLWHTTSALADGLVAFRAQPQAVPSRPRADAAFELCLRLHADAWHWLKIEVVDKWTGQSRTWLEGGPGTRRCLQKPAGLSWFPATAKAGDEYDIFVTPISIDGAEGRRSEPVSLTLPEARD